VVPKSRPDRDRDLQDLLDLLVGRREPVSGERDLTDRLNVELPLTTAAVTAPLGRSLHETSRHVARTNAWAVVGVADGRVVVLSHRPPRGLPAGTGSAPIGADGKPEEIAAAVGLAAGAADVAVRLGARLVEARAVAPLVAILAMDQREQTAFLADCFAGLATDPRGAVLLATAAAVLTYPRNSEAARALHVHRHTLDYRMRRFREHTGLDLAEPATRFRCELGLFLLGLFPFESRPAGGSGPPADP